MTLSPSSTLESPSRDASKEAEARVEVMPDIEHMPVADDPRAWCPFRKVCASEALELIRYSPPQNLTLFLVASASMTAGFAVNIQNRELFRVPKIWSGADASFQLLSERWNKTSMQALLSSA